MPENKRTLLSKDRILLLISDGEKNCYSICKIIGTTDGYIYQCVKAFRGKSYLERVKKIGMGFFYQLTPRGKEYLENKYGRGIDELRVIAKRPSGNRERQAG